MILFSIAVVISVTSRLCDAYCYVPVFDSMVFAFCNGTFTAQNASDSCLLNGYQLAGQFDNMVLYGSIA